MATLKRAVILFFIYYIFLIAGAAILMYTEERGLATDKFSVVNITDPLARFLHNDLKVIINASMLNKIVEISQSIASKSKAIQNQAWKKDVSLETLRRWRYFTQAILATAGALMFTSLMNKIKSKLILHNTVDLHHLMKQK